MLSLILMVLFVNIAIYLVNTIGASTIDNLVCPENISRVWFDDLDRPRCTSKLDSS